MKTYTLEQLNIEFSKLDPTSWPAMTTEEFLKYLAMIEEAEKEVKFPNGSTISFGEVEDPLEGNSPFESAADAEADNTEADLQ